MVGAFSSAFSSAFDATPDGVNPGALTLAGTAVKLNTTLTPGAATLSATGQTPATNNASATFLGSVQGASTDGFSATTAGLDTTGAGALFAFIASQAFVPDPYLTDSKGNQWTRWGQGNASSTSVALTLWYCSPSTVGAGHTLTVTEQGQTFPAIHFLAFACAPILGLVNAAASAGGSGLTNTFAPGSITPSASNAIVVTGLANSGGTPTSLTGGFTLDQATALVGSQHYGLGSAHLIQTTAAASNPTWTNNAFQRLASIQAAFLVGQTATAEDRVSQLALESVSVASVGDQRTSQLVLESLIATGATIIPRGNLSLAGQLPGVGNGRHVPVGALALTGQAPAASTSVGLGVGALAITGYVPVLNASVQPGVGTLAITGYATADVALPAAADLALNGGAPTLAVRTAIEAGAGMLAVSGAAPVLVTSVQAAVPAGTLVLTGTSVSRVTGAPTAVAAGALTLAGHAPTTAIAVSGAQPGGGVVTLLGHAPTSLNNSAIGNLLAQPDTGRLTLRGYVPGQAFTFPLDRTVPVDPPAGSGECTDAVTDEGSGGRGANGCNPGGTGWTSSYAGPWGAVPDHTDVTVGDTIGDGTASLWVEIADGTTETKVAAVWLADAAVVARGGLLASGRIEHALGNEQGGYEVATISLGFFDEQDRLMRSGADDIEGDELRVKLIVEN